MLYLFSLLYLALLFGAVATHSLFYPLPYRLTSSHGRPQHGDAPKYWEATPRASNGPTRRPYRLVA